tara:strand:+ start:204 stop:680 length:477 start_codon:yes stop_codon:yes gene_type:complete
MADFSNTPFVKHDDYMTPLSAWENIKQYIPHDRVIWEAFYGDGKSGNNLTELGFNVIHEPIDFFESDEGEIIVSNPPFSIVKDIIPRLVELDKPFILLMPVSKIAAQYFRPFKDKIQIIIPHKRIQFIKDGNELRNHCSFDCFYYCYKIGLEKDIIWL